MFMTEPTPLTFMRLLAWVDDRLPTTEAALVAAQLTRANLDTSAELAWFSRLLRFDDADTPDVPLERLRLDLLRRLTTCGGTC
jgi:hypothetical protein